MKESLNYICTQVIEYTHQDNSFSGSEGKDVGAGHGATASCLDPGFDCVDHLESPDGVLVRAGGLLAGECGRVVQQNRRIAALLICMNTGSTTVRTTI